MRIIKKRTSPRPVKIVRTDARLECPHLDRVLVDSGVDLVRLADGVGEARLARETRDADVILMCYTPITARVIDGAAQLKGIVKYGVGIDAIDIEAAKTRKIPVVNVPEYAGETVAEGVFALLIALAKKLLPLHHAMQRDGWAWPTARWAGNDLAGKTIGLVGAGRIGCSFARMAGAGFRMRVLGYDPNAGEAALRARGIEKTNDLKTMLGECDFVSIHATLNPDTHHLLGAGEFAVMKPTAILVNVSRGAIVDEAALLRALKNQQIAGAALDVYNQEPLSLTGHPLSELYGMDNVILFPHLTFYTEEAMHRLERETLERCFEILRDDPVLIKSADPRLRAQKHGVTFADNSAS